MGPMRGACESGLYSLILRWRRQREWRAVTPRARACGRMGQKGGQRVRRIRSGPVGETHDNMGHDRIARDGSRSWLRSNDSDGPSGGAGGRRREVGPGHGVGGVPQRKDPRKAGGAGKRRHRQMPCATAHPDSLASDGKKAAALATTTEYRPYSPYLTMRLQWIGRGRGRFCLRATYRHPPACSVGVHSPPRRGPLEGIARTRRLPQTCANS